MSTAVRAVPNSGRRVAVPRVSRFLLWGFRRHLTVGFGLRGGYVPRHFHAVRLTIAAVPTFPTDRPLVFFLNHPGWWDPIIAFLLARHLVPHRQAFAPIEQTALDRYPLIGRLGLFGVDASPRGARRFLQTAQAVLARHDASLWLTPQGTFCDSGARPVRFRPGLGHVAAHSSGLFVPVALEYRYWNERLPEVLCRLGEPLDTGERRASAADWTSRFEQALEATMNSLADDAARRDAGAFQTILGGGEGVGPLYDVGRRVRSLWTGQRYRAAHGRGA